MAQGASEDWRRAHSPAQSEGPQGEPTRPARLRGDPSHGRPWHPRPSPAALLGSGSFSLLRFQFTSSDGPSVPLADNRSIASLGFGFGYPPSPCRSSPGQAKALWSPLVRELWTFCSCVVTAELGVTREYCPGNFLPTSTPEETVYWGHKITLLPKPSLILSAFYSVL